MLFCSKIWEKLILKYLFFSFSFWPSIIILIWLIPGNCFSLINAFALFLYFFYDPMINSAILRNSFFKKYSSISILHCFNSILFFVYTIIYFIDYIWIGFSSLLFNWYSYPKSYFFTSFKSNFFSCIISGKFSNFFFSERPIFFIYYSCFIIFVSWNFTVYPNNCSFLFLFTT